MFCFHLICLCRCVPQVSDVCVMHVPHVCWHAVCPAVGAACSKVWQRDETKGGNLVYRPEHWVAMWISLTYL